MGSGSGGVEPGEEKCEHCHCQLNLRNPSGYCDHLHYPENCKICNKSETMEENFVKTIVKLLEWNGQIHPTDDFDVVMHEGKKFHIMVKELKS